MEWDNTRDGQEGEQDKSQMARYGHKQGRMVPILTVLRIMNEERIGIAKHSRRTLVNFDGLPGYVKYHFERNYHREL